MKPLVSICIPTFNRAKLLRRAISSAQNQTYPNIEIIVTDNCSTDDTEQVVANIAQTDPRIRYIRNETNVGPTRNWQIAVNAARGDFCKILYSDDEMANGFVSSCIEQFESGQDVAFALTDAIIGSSFDDGELSRSYIHTGISDSREYILQYLLWNVTTVSPSCALFRTADVASKIVTENPYFEVDKYAQNGAGPDSLIFLNAALSHSEIAYIERPLTLFGTSKDSFTVVAGESKNTLISLLNCYARARYHFLKMLTGDENPLWYLRFLSTLYIPVRNRTARKTMSNELKLKNRGAFSLFDYAYGVILRHCKARIIRPRIIGLLGNRFIQTGHAENQQHPFVRKTQQAFSPETT